MAKAITKTLDDAIALYRQGHSPRECDRLTGVNYKKIEREAKRLGIVKGDLSHLTERIVKDTSDFVSLDVANQDAVRHEVAKKLEGLQFYQENGRKAVKIGLMAFSKDPTPQGMKATLEAMKIGMIVEGLVPFYPTAATINNTNAQQINVEPSVMDKEKAMELIEKY